MTKESLLRKIKREFPELKWKRHRYLTHGWDHVVIILDEKLVFRMPKKNPKDLQSELGDEIRLLHYLKKRVKVGIPRYSHVSRDQSMGGYPMMSGRELGPDQFRRLSVAEKESIAQQLAAFLTTLHRTPKTILKKYRVRTENYSKFYDELVRDAKNLLFPRLTKKDIRLIEEYLEELKVALGHPHPMALIHNDLVSDHILWDGDKKQVNVIDFSDRSLGDPAWDFGGILEYGPKFAKKIFKFYRAKKDEPTWRRANLYYKRIPLAVMKNALQGYPCTFKEGYEMFKKRFR